MVLYYVQIISIREYIIAAAVYWIHSIYYSCCCRLLEYYHTDNCGVMCSLLESEHWELTVSKLFNIIKLKFSCTEIRAFIVVVVACHENFQYFNTEMLCSCITFVHT